jgi:hypothetical protein
MAKAAFLTSIFIGWAMITFAHANRKDLPGKICFLLGITGQILMWGPFVVYIALREGK